MTILQQINKKKAPYLFVLPAFLILTAALLIPVVSGIKLSFFEAFLRNINTRPLFVGFRNYIELFKSEYFHTSIFVTIKFTFFVVSIEMILGFILALILEGNVPGIRLFRTIFILPMMIAPVVVGVVWKFLYHPSYGKLNYILQLLSIKPVGWLSDPKVALWSIIMTDIWQWVPFVFLLLLAGLQGVPKELTDAGEVDGANYLQNLFHIKIPYLANVIGITVVLRMIDAFRGLVVVSIMTNGGPGVSTEILSLHLYKTAFTDQRLGKASAIAVVLLGIIIVLSFVFVLQSINNKNDR